MISDLLEPIVALRALVLLLALCGAAAGEQTPAACAREVSVDTGQPVMFQRGSLVWGLSTKPVRSGEKLPVVLWLYNPTDGPLHVMSCGDIDFFWLRDIQVFDSSGKRVERRWEQKPGGLQIWTCGRNVAIEVPSRACLHGFASAPHDFVRDLNEYYLLAPGRYSLVAMKGPALEIQIQPKGDR